MGGVEPSTAYEVLIIFRGPLEDYVFLTQLASPPVVPLPVSTTQLSPSPDPQIQPPAKINSRSQTHPHTNRIPMQHAHQSPQSVDRPKAAAGCAAAGICAMNGHLRLCSFNVLAPSARICSPLHLRPWQDEAIRIETRLGGHGSRGGAGCFVDRALLKARTAKAYG